MLCSTCLFFSECATPPFDRVDPDIKFDPGSKYYHAYVLILLLFTKFCVTPPWHIIIVGCQNWCFNGATAWAKKCKWQNLCSGCRQCFGERFCRCIGHARSYCAMQVEAVFIYSRICDSCGHPHRNCLIAAPIPYVNM